MAPTSCRFCNAPSITPSWTSACRRSPTPTSIRSGGARKSRSSPCRSSCASSASWCRSQGHRLPGTHIPIRHPDAIRETKPDYVLILPWNLKDEIMRSEAYILEWDGRFVVPIPGLQILPQLGSARPDPARADPGRGLTR